MMRCWQADVNKAADVVEELGMLLTGRHLSNHTATILTRIFEKSTKKLPDIDPKLGVLHPGCYYRTPAGCHSGDRHIRYSREAFILDIYTNNATSKQSEKACLVDRKAELQAACNTPWAPNNVETLYRPDDGLRKVSRES